MSQTCELTLTVPREAIAAKDWRDDERWDRLVELAYDLFPGFDVDALGCLRDNEESA